MQLTTRKTIDSAAIPGVRFTVRRLGKTQRAARDLQTMEQRRKCAALAREWRALLPAMAEDGVTFLKPEDDTAANRDARARIDEEYGLLMDSAIKPASIRAALVSIENLAVDGKLVTTAKDFLDADAPALDDLGDEIFRACEEASGLTDEERKNLQPPTISSELAAGATSGSTVTPAGA